MIKSNYLFVNKFQDLTDEDLIIVIREGNQDALTFLIEKYKNLVSIKISRYFIIGAEKDDIFQEGLIGLFKAIKGYESDKQNSFKTFANLCIERQLITAIKTSNRQKHMPLNSSVSLNTSAYEEDEDTQLLEILNNHTIEDPLDTLTKKEYYNDIGIKISTNLSGFEKQVLNKYIKGESYIKIAEDLESPIKSIDNAIQRIRKKAIKNIVEY